jgi:drug/metabolite transporter (DMT)-like permease
MPTATLFFAAVAIWGTTWIAITFQLHAATPEAGVAWRFLCAAALLAAWCAWRGLSLRFDRRLHLLFALQGLAGFCISYLFVYHAERFIVSGLVAVGYAASPLVNMALAKWLFDTPLSRRVTAGGVLGLAGIVLVFGHEFARLDLHGPVAIGAALTVGAVLLSGCASMAAMRYHALGVSGWPPLAWAMAYGGVATLAVALALGRSLDFAFDAAAALSFVYLVIAGSILAFGAYFALLERIGPARAGYIGVMVPIVALLISSLFEGYRWTGLTVVGIALAVMGNVLALHTPATRRPARASAERRPCGP